MTIIIDKPLFECYSCPKVVTSEQIIKDNEIILDDEFSQLTEKKLEFFKDFLNLVNCRANQEKFHSEKINKNEIIEGIPNTCRTCWNNAHKEYQFQSNFFFRLFTKFKSFFKI